LEGNETFDSNLLGEAEKVSEEKISDSEMLFFYGTKKSASSTIIIRGANEFLLDEIDRSLHDALMIVKKNN